MIQRVGPSHHNIDITPNLPFANKKNRICPNYLPWCALKIWHVWCFCARGPETERVVTHVLASGPKTVLVKRLFFVWSMFKYVSNFSNHVHGVGWGGVGWGGLLTFCPRRTSKYDTNFSNLNHVHGVGWGGVLTFCPWRTSKYVTNFSNHRRGPSISKRSSWVSNRSWLC